MAYISLELSTPIAPSSSSDKPILVVVGNGMVGHHFVEKAIEKGLHQTHQIHVFVAESRPAYDRVYLSSYFEHGDADQLNLVDQQVYATSGVTLHLGESVDSIDTTANLLTTSNGKTLHYAVMVLATESIHLCHRFLARPPALPCVSHD